MLDSQFQVYLAVLMLCCGASILRSNSKVGISRDNDISISQVAEPKALLECLQSLVNSKDLNLDDALSLFTKNPANRLKLTRKGQVGLDVELPIFCL